MPWISIEFEFALCIYFILGNFGRSIDSAHRLSNCRSRRGRDRIAIFIVARSGAGVCLCEGERECVNVVNVKLLLLSPFGLMKTQIDRQYNEFRLWSGRTIITFYRRCEFLI